MEGDGAVLLNGIEQRSEFFTNFGGIFGGELF
jgi:hypothetical protein